MKTIVKTTLLVITTAAAAYVGKKITDKQIRKQKKKSLYNEYIEVTEQLSALYWKDPNYVFDMPEEIKLLNDRRQQIKEELDSLL